MSKRAFKTEPAPCRKSPQEGPHPRGKKKRQKKEKGKQKREKERKIIVIRRILQIQNVSLVAKWDIFAGKVLLYRDKNPRQLTPGLSSSSNSSSGLDLSSAMATILTPDVLVTPILTGVASLLPEDIVRLVLGCSSLSFRRISVVPGVVDSDYTGEIKVLISSPAKTVEINKGQKIAQLLLLPYYQTEKP